MACDWLACAGFLTNIVQQDSAELDLKRNLLATGKTITSLFAIAGLAVSAIAQTTIPADRTYPVTPGPKLDTRAFAPQIDKSYRKRPFKPENPLINVRRAAQPNNTLKAGGLIPSVRVAELQGYFPAIGATGSTPPDPDLAVGPTHAVAVVNSSIGFFRKSDGANTFLRNSEDFFAGLGATSFQFDPKVLYDTVSKRFFILFLEVDFSAKVSKSLIAVSDDSDPNGTWFRYRVESKQTVGSTDFWLDYPGWGVSKKYLGFCGNMFGFENGWNGNQFVVIDKAPLLTGAAATASSVPDTGSASVKLVSQADGDDLIAVSMSADDSMRVHAVTATAARSTEVRVPTFAGPAGPVPGPNNHNLDALDARLINAHLRNGNIVTTHGVRVGNDPRVVARWYDVRLNGWPATGQPALAQSGNVSGGTGQFFHMPAVARNRRNEMALVFTRTSSSIMADLMITGRKQTDALGTMGAPVRIKTTPALYGGSGANSYNRWGDYFQVVVDPVDEVTFWAIGMIGRADGNWTTEVFPFKVSSYEDALVSKPATSMATLPSQGTLRTTGTTRINTADGVAAEVASQFAKNVGDMTSLETTINSGLTPSTIGQLRVSTLDNAPAGSSSFYYAWNNLTSKWDQLGTYPGSSTARRFDRIEGQASPYIAANGNVKLLVRVVQPLRSVSRPYVLKVDQLGISVAPRS